MVELKKKSPGPNLRPNPPLKYSEWAVDAVVNLKVQSYCGVKTDTDSHLDLLLSKPNTINDI